MEIARVSDAGASRCVASASHHGNTTAPLVCGRTPVWEVEDYVRDTESHFVNKVYTSVDKVSYQDGQMRKLISFNEAVMPCAL